MGKSDGNTVCRLAVHHFELTGHGDEESQRLQIPFVVIEEALQKPILGFNAIKVLVNKSDNLSALITSLTNNLVNTNRSNISTLFNLINTSRMKIY